MAYFGDLRLCLPKIDGLTECYLTPLVKDLADRTEYQENTVVAYYLRSADYATLMRQGAFYPDEYFKVYGVNIAKNLPIGFDDLDLLYQKMTSAYVDRKWNEIEAIVEGYRHDVSFDKPVFIERYAPGSDIRTFAMLLKSRTGGVDNIMIVYSNMILVKKRLIWLTFYKEFTGQESIRQARAKNDYYALRLLSINR